MKSSITPASLAYSTPPTPSSPTGMSSPSPPVGTHPPHSVALARNPPNGPISRILRFRTLFRLALVAAVSIGITGAIQSSSGTTTTTIDTGNTLRKIAIYIFFVCSLLVFLQTFFLARVEFSGMHLLPKNPSPSLSTSFHRGWLSRCHKPDRFHLWHLHPFGHLPPPCRTGGLLYRNR